MKFDHDIPIKGKYFEKVATIAIKRMESDINITKTNLTISRGYRNWHKKHGRTILRLALFIISGCC
jgi:hypothetical protein